MANNHVLAVLKKCMDAAEIPYAYYEWNSATAAETDYYFVSEYMETATEDRAASGRQQGEIILRGFTRGTHDLLEGARNAIAERFPHTEVLEDGTCVSIWYDYAQTVPNVDYT